MRCVARVTCLDIMITCVFNYSHGKAVIFILMLETQDLYSQHVRMHWTSPLVARFPPIAKLSIQDTPCKKLYLTSVTEKHELH